jgi:hypothetical protein
MDDELGFDVSPTRALVCSVVFLVLSVALLAIGSGGSRADGVVFLSVGSYGVAVYSWVLMRLARLGLAWLGRALLDRAGQAARRQLRHAIG